MKWSLSRNISQRDKNRPERRLIKKNKSPETKIWEFKTALKV